MTERARAATLEDLKRLLAALNEEQADYLLIGGYALMAHGYPRATVDIDLLIRRTKQSARERDVADRAVIERALAVAKGTGGRK